MAPLYYFLCVSNDQSRVFFPPKWMALWNQISPWLCRKHKRSSARIQCTAIDSTKFKSPHLSGLFKSGEGIQKRLVGLFPDRHSRHVDSPSRCVQYIQLGQPACNLSLNITLWSAAPERTWLWWSLHTWPLIRPQVCVSDCLSVLCVWGTGGLFILSSLFYEFSFPNHYYHCACPLASILRSPLSVILI